MTVTRPIRCRRRSSADTGLSNKSLATGVGGAWPRGATRILAPNPSRCLSESSINRTARFSHPHSLPRPLSAASSLPPQYVADLLQSHRARGLQQNQIAGSHQILYRLGGARHVREFLHF